MRTPKLAALELRKFGRGRLPRAAMAALLLLPLLYGALYLWSFWDPYGRLNKIPVALVNADQGATARGHKLTAGDDIARKLSHSSASFDWQETDAAHAAKGVEDGKYYLSLTIPADFSRRVASSSGNDPQTGALQVRTNDANNYVVGQISRSVFAEIRAAASANASRSFYDNIFVSFSDIHDKTQHAAQGADDLHGGIDKAQQATGQLAKGLGTAKNASDQIGNGLDTLQSATGQLADGVHTAADGTQKLADKVNGSMDSYGPFLKSHSKEIGDIAQLVADASQTIRDNLTQLPQKAAQLATKAQTNADNARAYYRTHCGAVPQPGADCGALKDIADGADQAAKAARDVDTLVKDNSSSFDKIDGDLKTLHSLAQRIADEAPTLPTDMDNAVAQVNALNSGLHKLATGADGVHDGTTTAKNAIDSLGSGIGDLKSGAQSINGGMYKLSDGSNTLATGLKDGVQQIPDYGKQDRDTRTSVMSDPVRLLSQATHKAPTYGTGLAPYFIPLSLWVGAMVAYMLMQPLSKRALSAGAPAWRIALAGWLPVAAIGVLQTGALLSVLHWAIGLQMARAAGTVGFLMLVAACFAAMVQLLNARFGPAGRVLVLALLMLQLTSAGGTYPVQASPGFFNAIHPFLPMSYIVDGLRHLITGGELWPVWRACLVLLAFTAGSLTLTAWSARRKQVWTVDRLHPEISL
ncbi:YhgE/Pip domain-containing protein [Streptomyces sp. NPDC020096]